MTATAATFVKALVVLTYSENRQLNRVIQTVDGEPLPLNEINKALRLATHDVLRRNGGYDKTGYVFKVETSDGETHEYSGRLDVGSDTKGMMDVIQESIKSFTDYYLNQPKGQWGHLDDEARASYQQWNDWAQKSIIDARAERVAKYKD